MNALDSDVLVVLVKDPKPVVSAYVRTQDSYTLTGIADGTYTLYYGEGTDWDGSEFTREVQDHRSQDPLKFTTTTTANGRVYSTWTVTLYKSITNGPAPVSVPPTEFPKPPPDQDKERP
jgi:hypothetical protein